MNTRHILMIGITVLMLGALMTGVVQALETQPAPMPMLTTLENVRAYAPAATDQHTAYAVDAGNLYTGAPGSWAAIRTPNDIIVSSVALDSQRPDIVYIGAANKLTVFKSADGGLNWLRVPLSDTPGGVTDIAVDSAQRLVYAGTDTAGVFRLRDVGSSLIVGGQLLLDEPVRQVATDSTGVSMAFARTGTTLYRADDFGLSWSIVDNLHSSPTAIAIADTMPASVYIGTVDRGVLSSTDGQTWTMVNEGLGMSPGARLHVDAVAVDPQQPEQVYVAASYLHGSTTVHQTPSHIAASSDGAETWNLLNDKIGTLVADLLPVSGAPGAVYVLTTESRSPLALFDAPAIVSSPVETTRATASVTIPVPSSTMPSPIPAAWLIAALAALALGIVVTHDLHRRGIRPLPQGIQLASLETQTVASVG